MVSLLLDIVTTAAILYVVALGLLIVFGVMGIISFAHGAMLTVGGYAALLVTWAGWNPWLSLPAAALAGLLAGAAMERTVLRPLYRRPLDAILATWGLGIVIGQVITLAFGRQVQFAQSPLSGAATVLGETYSQYRLLLVVVAVLLAGGIALMAAAAAGASMMFVRVLGGAGVSLGSVVLLVLGNSTSGGSLPTDFLPAWLYPLSRILPVGVGVRALDGLAYFHHDGLLTAVLVLSGWIVGSVAVLVLCDELDARHRAQASAVAPRRAARGR